jgi:glycine cleavage system H protein
MKEIADLKLPDDVKYAEDHEWTRDENGQYRIGVSDFAQDQLGDITFVELPEVGDVFEKGDEFGTLESTKAVADLYLPISGEVTEVNSALEDSPGLVNEDPYGKGWVALVKPSNPAELEALMNREAYLEFLEGMEKEEGLNALSPAHRPGNCVHARSGGGSGYGRPVRCNP